MTLPGPLGLHRSPQGRLMEVGRKLKEQGPVGEPGVLKGVETKQKELVAYELASRGPEVLAAGNCFLGLKLVAGRNLLALQQVAGNHSQVQLQVVGNY